MSDFLCDFPRKIGQNLSRITPPPWIPKAIALSMPYILAVVCHISTASLQFEKDGKISIDFEDLSRNSVFFRTEVKPYILGEYI